MMIPTYGGNVHSRGDVHTLLHLADGDEICTAIELATQIDDIILAAIKKVVQMIKKVEEGFDLRLRLQNRQSKTRTPTQKQKMT